MAIDQDLELMLRVGKGDEESFQELLRRYRLPLVQFFCRYFRDQGLAEDLAQEVFLRVYKARHHYRPDARFTTWLFRIATNLALNTLRDRRAEGRQQAMEDEEGSSRAFEIRDGRPNVEQRMMQSDRERMIRREVGTLPENQRAAVILHKYQDVNYVQIAKILGVSESAVKSLLFRAYETLRVRLSPLIEGGKL